MLISVPTLLVYNNFGSVYPLIQRLKLTGRNSDFHTRLLKVIEFITE